MLKIESKLGNIPVSDEKIYNFLSDFNNFTNLIPQDKIRNWEATENSCRFSADGLGEIGMKIIEKEPYKLVKVTGDENSKFNFFLWIQLKSIEVLDTRIKLTIHADINPMMEMIAKSPLQKVVDMLVDKIVDFFQKTQNQD